MLNQVKGIGTKSLSLLNNLNIYTLEDLVTYYPFRYNFIKIDNIHNVKDKNHVIVEGIIESNPILRRFGKMNSLTFRVNINNKIITTTIFNRAFMKNNLTIGSFVTIFGKYNEEKSSISASNIVLKRIQDNTIEPVYHLTNGLSEKNIRKFINEGLNVIHEIPDYIPEYLNQKYNFISKKESVNLIHNPKSLEDIKKAKVKLKYEELFMFMFKINYLKKINKNNLGNIERKVDYSKVEEYIKSLPFTLTNDQIKSVKEIYKDLTSNKRMNRLLEGDVGSGKTIVAVISSYINHLSGYVTALMAPTEVLATQHYESIKELLKNTNMRVKLLTGSMKKSEKDIIYKELKNKEIDLIIGTHALISDKIEFTDLGLVITDEQHRFGVNQRNNLSNKGTHPDVLYMSATPIPRTYALTLYGDMDISYLKEKPKGRKEIITIVKKESEIKDVLYLMLEEIKKGRQVYVVSPLIEDSDSVDYTSITKLKEKLDIAFNNKVKTEILHSKLDQEEKVTIMEEFKSGKTQILISTTVIEVGVDVKNATMMVIFDAEMFGLSTLHQLRGRIGRNEYDSYCVLIGDKNNKRLKVIEESNNGFYIAEEDFKQRKEGDLFGVRQSGDMAFKIADLALDYKILLQAKEDSQEFLEENIKNNFKNYKEYTKIVEDIKYLS